MKLTVVGCAGSFGRPDSACSAYLLEHDGYRVVLDLGSGAFGALQRYVGPYDFDAVVLSHLHADHCLDLCGVAVSRRHTASGEPVGPLPVHGPAGTYDRLMGAYGSSAAPGLGDVLDVASPISPGEREIGPFRFRFARVNHPVETYAMRIEVADGRPGGSGGPPGAGLVYSADTGRSDALIDLAAGADVLLCEATFDQPVGDEPPNPPDLHLSGAEAGEHARGADVGRLLLTHLTVWSTVERTLAEAGAEFDGELAAVRPGDTFHI